MRRKKGTIGGWIRPKKRYAVYVRDGHLCAWCGQRPDDFVLDHLYPRGHRLHTNDPRFLVTSCRPCNASRKATSLAAHLRRLFLSGFDVGAVVRRLARRRWPLDLTAGASALTAAMSEPFASLGPCPEWLPSSGVPFYVVDTYGVPA